MLLTSVVEDYILYSRVERGLTAKTCKTYCSMSRFFVKWLISTGHDAPTVDDFNVSTLRKYLYYVSITLKYRPRSIRGCFFPLRGLGEYLIEQGVLKTNPTHEIRLPKMDAARRELLSDADAQALLKACDHIANPSRSVLAKALLSVFIYGGLRRQEALDLKVGDVDIKDKSIVVRQGKGQKSRIIYPHPDCILAIRELVAMRPTNCRHDWLFAFSKARRVADNGLRTILAEVTAISGIDKPVMSHSLRHNCATRILRGGADLESLREFLGHSLLSTTAIYCHSDVTRQRQIANCGALRPDGNESDLKRSREEKRRPHRVGARRR